MSWLTNAKRPLPPSLHQFVKTLSRLNFNKPSKEQLMIDEMRDNIDNLVGIAKENLFALCQAEANEKPPESPETPESPVAIEVEPPEAVEGAENAEASNNAEKYAIDSSKGVQAGGTSPPTKEATYLKYLALEKFSENIKKEVPKGVHDSLILGRFINLIFGLLFVAFSIGSAVWIILVFVGA